MFQVEKEIQVNRFTMDYLKVLQFKFRLILILNLLLKKINKKR